MFYNKDSSYYKIYSNTHENKMCTDLFSIDVANENHLNYYDRTNMGCLTNDLHHHPLSYWQHSNKPEI
jgi:hypothetical protein